MALPCFSAQSRSLQEDTKHSPHYSKTSRESGLPGDLREERGGWQSQVSLGNTHLRPQRRARGCRWLQGASLWWTTACPHGAPVLGLPGQMSTISASLRGSRAAGDQPCYTHKSTGMEGWHQWHRALTNSGVVVGGGGQEGRQGEPCTSDPVLPAFYSGVQRSQEMILSDQN